MRKKAESEQYFCDKCGENIGSHKEAHCYTCGKDYCYKCSFTQLSCFNCGVVVQVGYRNFCKECLKKLEKDNSEIITLLKEVKALKRERLNWESKYYSRVKVIDDKCREMFSK